MFGRRWLVGRFRASPWPSSSAAQVVKLAGYGLASVELDVPVTRTPSSSELASLTKQFTPAAVMKLVEEGKVGLDEPVAKYLPPTPSAWSAITIRHLLTHTAGLSTPGKDFVALSKGGIRMAYTIRALFDAATKDSMSLRRATDSNTALSLQPDSVVHYWRR